MTGHAGEVGVGEGGVNSVVLTAGLLPHRGWEAFGDDLAEHQQDFLTPRRRQARPSVDQWSGKPRGLQARGGTAEWWELDMVALRAIGQAIRCDVTGTTVPAAARAVALILGGPASVIQAIA